MKTRKFTAARLTVILMMVFCIPTAPLFSQTKTDVKSKTECCFMKEGKMMRMTDGKMMPMTTEMTMKNGTKCMPNGECVDKDGKKIALKEGEHMKMSGKICTAKQCSMACRKTCKEETKGMYSCPMHKDVTSDKPGKCPKCKMDLEKNK